MAIDDEWTVNTDYTQTYTVTVDELNGAYYDPAELSAFQRIKKVLLG